MLHVDGKRAKQFENLHGKRKDSSNDMEFKA